MTTHHYEVLANGDTLDIRTNVGAEPLVFINGVLQPKGLYQIVHSSNGTLTAVKVKPREWKSITIWWPRRINGRWHYPGSTLYRYFTLSPGGGFWVYGDIFDMLKDSA